jgi:cyclophilin family peptidyl-prolyl cis-trans isomerase
MQPCKFTIAGKIQDPAFHKCVTAAKYLQEQNPETVTIECLQFFETQWEEYIKRTANKLKGVFYQHSGSHLIILNDSEYIGNGEQFASYILHNFAYMDNSMSIVYERLAANTFKKMINTSKTRKYAELELSFSGITSTVYFELFNDIAPRTVANFLGLCNGHKRSDNVQVGYMGTDVHRIVKGMYIQMGKITPDKAPELGTSIYGGAFEDESFHLKHQEIGMLGMCKRNGLSHTNESQFYITMGAPLTFLDNKNVIFGRVIMGMRALKLVEKLETTNERPNEAVKITKSQPYTAA